MADVCWEPFPIMCSAPEEVESRQKIRAGPLLLQMAVKQREYDMIQKLLDASWFDNSAVADVSDGNSPVHWAVRLGDLTSLRLLLAAHVPLDDQNYELETPLILAAEAGQEAVMRTLISAGCDLYKSKWYGRTALHLAVERQHAGCVQVLVDAGMDVNHRDSDGRSALHMAADSGSSSLLSLLLGAGCGVDAEDADGQTPLFASVWRGHTECARRLVAAGADINKVNRSGNTPLTTAALLGQADVLKILLSVQPGVPAALTPKRRGVTWPAVHVALNQGHEACARLLLQHGGAGLLQQQTASGCEPGLTPAHVVLLGSASSEASAVSLLRLLLQYACDFDRRSLCTVSTKRRLVTPFELAVSTGKLQVACWLVLTDVTMNLIHTWLTATSNTDHKLTDDDVVIAWLTARASIPISLSQACRKVIRRCLDNRLVSAAVEEIPLPGRLRRFVAFSEDVMRELEEELPFQLGT